MLYRKMIATFKENMELRRFPFDRQLLQFYITARVTAPHVKMVVDAAEPSTCFSISKAVQWSRGC